MRGSASCGDEWLRSQLNVVQAFQKPVTSTVAHETPPERTEVILKIVEDDGLGCIAQLPNRSEPHRQVDVFPTRNVERFSKTANGLEGGPVYKGIRRHQIYRALMHCWRWNERLLGIVVLGHPSSTERTDVSCVCDCPVRRTYKTGKQIQGRNAVGVHEEHPWCVGAAPTNIPSSRRAWCITLRECHMEVLKGRKADAGARSVVDHDNAPWLAGVRERGKSSQKTINAELIVLHRDDDGNLMDSNRRGRVETFERPRWLKVENA